MADIFGKTPLNLKDPITADKCTIMFDGTPVGEAMQFSIEYSQSITRRRSIGNKSAVVYGSQPSGRAMMALLLTTDGENERGASWKGCLEGTLSFQLGGGCDGSGTSTNGRTLSATGCIVSSFSMSASADDLTVAENVVIEFMELSEK